MNTFNLASRESGALQALLRPRVASLHTYGIGSRSCRPRTPSTVSTSVRPVVRMGLFVQRKACSLSPGDVRQVCDWRPARSPAGAAGGEAPTGNAMRVPLNASPHQAASRGQRKAIQVIKTNATTSAATINW